MDLDGGSPNVKTTPVVGKTWNSMGQVRADDLRTPKISSARIPLSAGHENEMIYPSAVKTCGGIAEPMRVSDGVMRSG